MKFKEYIHRVAVSADQFVNVLLGGNIDETLSSRCFRNSQKYWYAAVARVVLDLIFRPCGKDHCYQAYLSEVNRRHLWKEAQKN